MSAAASFAVNKQARLVLDPRDEGGNVVVLDPNALTITATDGGMFAYNPDTNGAVFFLDVAGTAHYTVSVDGQPGPGQSFLSFDVDITVTPIGAVSVGESLSTEDKGTPP